MLITSLQESTTTYHNSSARAAYQESKKANMSIQRNDKQERARQAAQQIAALRRAANALFHHQIDKHDNGIQAGVPMTALRVLYRKYEDAPVKTIRASAQRKVANRVG